MLFYSALGFIRPALALILIPIYLNVFSEREWAIYSLMLVVGGFLIIWATLRINSAMLTKYYDYFHDRALLKEYLSSLFTSSFLIGIVVLTIGALTGERIFEFVFKSEDILFYPYGFTILLYAVLGEINQVYVTYLRNEKNLRRYAGIVLTQVLLVIILQFILIVLLRTGVQGAIMGMVAANAITLVMILVFERGIWTSRINWTMVRSSLAFSIPLLPYLMIYWFMTKGERIVIERFMDLELVGKYILLVTITGVSILFIEAVINGIRPFLFELFKSGDDDSDDTISLLTSLVVNVPLLALPAIYLLGNNLQLITPNEEWYVIVPYLAFASIVAYSMVYSKLFYQQLVFHKASYAATVLSSLSAAFFIVALVILIPLHGIWGVLYAVLFVNLMLGLLFYIYGQKLQPVVYPVRQVIMNPLMVVGALLVSDYYITELLHSRRLASLLIALGLTALIYGLNRKNIRDYKNIFIEQKVS